MIFISGYPLLSAVITISILLVVTFCVYTSNKSSKKDNTNKRDEWQNN